MICPYKIGQAVLVSDGKGWEKGIVVDIHPAQVMLRVTYTVTPANGFPYRYVAVSAPDWSRVIKTVS